MREQKAEREGGKGVGQRGWKERNGEEESKSEKRKEKERERRQAPRVRIKFPFYSHFRVPRYYPNVIVKNREGAKVKAEKGNFSWTECTVLNLNRAKRCVRQFVFPRQRATNGGIFSAE